jgi:hypothetical protein
LDFRFWILAIRNYVARRREVVRGREERRCWTPFFAPFA